MNQALKSWSLPDGRGVVHADASGALLILNGPPKRRHVVRTTEELERARSELFHAFAGKGELRPAAVNALITAWQHHVDEFGVRMERNAALVDSFNRAELNAAGGVA